MRLRFPVNRAAAAALICLSAGAVHAQGLPSIRIGQTVQSTLGERDPSFVEHGRFKAYRFDAAAGETYLITLRSRSFNPYLSVAWLVGGLSEVLIANDDGVAGTDSRIRWRAPADGSYVVVAQSFTREGAGAFTLNLDRAPQPTTAAPRQIQPGDTISGELAETDAVEEDDSFFDTYLLQATRGQRLRMEMRSDAFDTFLAFGRDGSGGWQVLDTDDDGLGEGTDSRLLVTIPEDGVYAIRANSVGQAAVGPYQLRVVERAAPASPNSLTMLSTMTRFAALWATSCTKLRSTLISLSGKLSR